MTAARKRWQCRFCLSLNEPVKRTCASCGVRRAAGRKSVSKTADVLWAKLIKLRVGHCESCGRAPAYGIALHAPQYDIGLEAAHVIPRRHRSVRWDLDNGRALCRVCHRYYTLDEKAWRDFIGPEWDRLWVKAQQRWDGTYPITELRAALAGR